MSSAPPMEGVPGDVPESLPTRNVFKWKNYLIPTRPPMFDYSVVPCLFAQSLPEYIIDEKEFNQNYGQKNFGLLLQNANGEPNWKALADKINELNDNAAPDENYKLFYLARHGEGPHNVTIEKWGHQLWDEDIAFMSEYKGYVFGPDPDLTEKGKAEAREINKIWKTQLEKYGLYEAGALPQKFYCSPFTRAVRTFECTWQDIVLDLPDAPRVLVREKLRESIGRHSCDKRGNMAVLKEKFPFVDIEEGMPDEDEIWGIERENEIESIDPRMRDALDDIFLKDGETTISITAHSGCLRCFLRVVNHRLFVLETSKMIPVVVKAKLKPEFKDTKLPARVNTWSYTYGKSNN